MCGHCGYIDFKRKSNTNILNTMIQTLNHRGPDNISVEQYSNKNAEVGLAHARLSIIDLSDRANQPMRFRQLTIVFNGEIYNFQEIKEELTQLGHHFEQESDTEMILHAYEQWGKDCLHKFIGMFSIVIHDKKNEEVIFVRDRVGAKPMHYYYKDDLFLFASEIKAIVKHPSFKKRIRTDVLHDYFKYAYIPSNNTIYHEVYKLPSGSFGVLNLKTKDLKINSYWDVYDFYKANEVKTIDYAYAKSHMHALLKSAILYRNVADVPVGVFLSGGYDSSLVAAILQNETVLPIKTFTIGFDTGNNEAPYAKEVATHLGTIHYEYYCTSRDAAKILEKIPFFFDEPFADSSAIPTTFVSQRAKEHVKVVISADGGDEIFCGYNHYAMMDDYNRLFKKINYVHDGLLSKITSAVAQLYPVTSFKRRKFTSLSRIFKEPDVYKESVLFEGFQTASVAVLDKLLKNKSSVRSHYKTNVTSFKDSISMCMAIDYKQYLQNDILTKVDRATMSASIEGREPLTDHRLIEYSASLPLTYKLKNGVKKRLLKDIVHEYIPQEMMDRPKAGFSVPIYNWLKTDLSYFLDDYLNREALETTGVFNTDFVLELVQDFRNSKLPDETLIWKLLMFQMWYKQWIQD